MLVPTILFYVILLLFTLVYLLLPSLGTQPYDLSQTESKTTKPDTKEPSASVKKKNGNLKSLIFLLLLFHSPVMGQNITVEITNMSTQKPAKNIESVKLIELAQGMNVLQEQKNTTAVVVFENTSLQENGNYMIQVDYRGVTYSETFNDPNLTSLKVDVWDVRKDIASKLDYRKIIYIAYQPNRLLFNVVTSFQNNSRYVFREDEGGVYLSLPKDVQDLETSVPLGGKSSSQLMWLPLKARPSQKKSDFYVLPHPIKPGFKVYQTSFWLPYTGKPLSFFLSEEYPMKDDIILKVAATDLQVSIEEQPNWQPSFQQAEEIGEYIALPSQKKLTLVFSGGKPQTPAKKEESFPIKVESPLKNWHKLSLISGSVFFIFFAFFFLNRNKGFISFAWVREQNRLYKEIALIKNSNLSSQEKEEKIKNLEEQISVLEQKIGSHDLS